ncbi:MAG: mechanosensitive ion channel [Planctomyces sp.]|nr:mechanosensitive ion channel [Planctomyces sp.]
MSWISKSRIGVVGMLVVLLGTTDAFCQTVAGDGPSAAALDSPDAWELGHATGQVTRTASRWVEEGKIFLRSRGLQFAVNLAAALLIFIVGRWLASAASRVACVMLTRAHVDEMLVRFLGNVIYTLLLIVVVMASMEMLGVNVTSLTAILAAAGFAIAMALQGSLSNFAAGIMLIILKPFKVGDYISAGSSTGTVEEINIFNTTLRTMDNVRLIVPNNQLTGSTISNFTAEPRRRIDLKVTCGYGDDLRAVKRFLEQLLREEPRVLQDPAPAVVVQNLADFAIELTLRGWVKTSDYGAVRADLLERIKLGFDANGFTIPFPSRDVYMHAAA